MEILNNDERKKLYSLFKNIESKPIQHTGLDISHNSDILLVDGL
jgi:hypothetical protein